MKHLMRDTDRHGNPRLYVRVPGQKKIRLKVPIEHQDFAVHYQAALRGVDLGVDLSGRPRAPQRAQHTFGALCAGYLRSPDFEALHKLTQDERRRVLDSCCLEETRPGSGVIMDQCPVDEFGPAHIRMLRDRKRAMPNVANKRLKILRRLFAWAIEDGRVTSANPVRDVQKLRVTTEGHHAWTLDEVSAYEARHPIGTHARLALGLALYTAQRVSDVVRMGPEHIQDGWLVLTQKKNSGTKPVLVEIPILPALQALLDATDTGETAFLVSARGCPFACETSFSAWFRERCNEAGLPQCSAHGLRKAAAAILIDLGCTREEVMAITGHTTNVEIERYMKSRNRRLLAGRAIAKLHAATSPQADTD